jgi:hypothetical protein
VDAAHRRGIPPAVGRGCWPTVREAVSRALPDDEAKRLRDETDAVLATAPGEREATPLYAEELSTIHEEIKRRGRCSRCDHLFVFHHYAGGPDRCEVDTCSCEL